MKICQKTYFLNNFVIFDQKFQNMGSFGHKFVIFDQELQKHGAFGCQGIIFNNFKGPLSEEWAEKWVLRGICTPITKKWYVLCSFSKLSTSFLIKSCCIL